MITDLPEPAARIDGGALGVGDGLLMLIREGADPLPAGAVVAVRTSDPSAAHDLPAWCRIMAHAYLGSVAGPGGSTFYFRKGDAAATAAGPKPDWGVRPPLRSGAELQTRDWLVGRASQAPERAPGATRCARCGPVVEPCAPTFD